MISAHNSPFLTAMLAPDESEMDEVLAALEGALEDSATVDLKKAETSMEAARLQSRMARGEYLPELRLVGQWRTEDTDVTDESVESWAAGLRLSWQLLDGWLRRSRKAETRAGLRGAEQRARLNYEDARANYRAGTLTLTNLGEFRLAWAESRFSLVQTFFSEQALLAEARSLLE